MIEELEKAVTSQKESSCCKYRYAFKSVWDNKKNQALFILLNPTDNSDSEGRAMELAHAWGYGGVTVCYLFGIYSKDAKSMKSKADPVGEYTDQFIKNEAKKHGLILGAWGTHGTHKGRYKDVLDLLKNYNIFCAGKSTKGFPIELLKLEITKEPVQFRQVGETMVEVKSDDEADQEIPTETKKKTKKKSTRKKKDKK